MAKQTEFVVVLVTCSKLSEARRIADRVVSSRLAACANILRAPVDSVYRWKGKMERAREYLLLIKSSRKRLSALKVEIKRLHSYEVPEFIALPIGDGSDAYLKWLGESLAPEAK